MEYQTSKLIQGLDTTGENVQLITKGWWGEPEVRSGSYLCERNHIHSSEEAVRVCKVANTGLPMREDCTLFGTHAIGLYCLCKDEEKLKELGIEHRTTSQVEVYLATEEAGIRYLEVQEESIA